MFADAHISSLDCLWCGRRRKMDAFCPQSPLHFPLLSQSRFSQIQPHILHTTLPTHVFINTARVFCPGGSILFSLVVNTTFEGKDTGSTFIIKWYTALTATAFIFLNQPEWNNVLLKDATKEHQNSTQNKDQNIYSMRDRHSKWRWKAFPGVWEARGVPLFSFTRGGLGPKFPYPTLSNACQEG